MRLPAEVQRAAIWDALEKHDGNREKTAEELGVSIRTLFRNLDRLNMYPQLDKAGWGDGRRPMRSSETEGLTVVRMQILAHLKASKDGRVDYGKLSMQLYGADTPGFRQRIYSALDVLKKLGLVTYNGVRFTVNDPDGKIAAAEIGK